MPFFRRRFRKRVKRAVKSKKSKDKSQDKRLNKLEKFLSPEYKTYTVTVASGGTQGQPVQTATAANTGGAIVANLFPIPAQGVGVAQRTGSDFAVHRLDASLCIETGAAGTNYVRWLIIESTAGTLETPSAAMILDQAIAGTDGYLDFINSVVNELRVDTKGLMRPKGYKSVSKKRYIIHHDEIIPVVQGSDKAALYKRYVKNFKSPYRLNSTTDAGTTNANGTWWSMLFPGKSTTAGNNPYLTGMAKVYYTDL